MFGERMTEKGATETILVVEDEPEVRNYLEISLRCHNYAVEKTEDGEEALQYLDRYPNRVSLVLLDIMMPRKGGLATLRQLRRSHPDLPVLMLSGASQTATVVEAIKGGANDFLTKPIGNAELALAVQRTLAASPLARGLESGRSEGCGGTWLSRNANLLRQIGQSEAPVLIQGETGVGKEVVARVLHSHSARCGRPFLKLNCAALPSELVESELFGFEKGAFTGAAANKPGKFDLADTGTLLLDEIGDMDFKLQAKLLQVLQDQQFERLGGRDTVRVDVRVLAATHCDLEAAITAGRFREDLFHRLNVISIHVPPLRERRDEIPALCACLLDKYGAPNQPKPAIPAELMEALLAYGWPGNIRELENLMRRYLVLHEPSELIAELELRSRALSKGGKRAPQGESPQPEAPPLPAMERVTEAQRKMESEVILRALESARWNRKQAAAKLGIDYKALLYKLKKLGIEGDRQD